MLRILGEWLIVGRSRKMGDYRLFDFSQSLLLWEEIPGDRCEAVLRLHERTASYDDLEKEERKSSEVCGNCRCVTATYYLPAWSRCLLYIIA